MHQAANRGHQGIVDILLQHGADVHVKDNRGKLIIFIHTYFIIGNITQYTFKFIIPDINSVENKKNTVKTAGQSKIRKTVKKGNGSESKKLIWLSNIEKNT